MPSFIIFDEQELLGHVRYFPSMCTQFIPWHFALHFCRRMHHHVYLEPLELALELEEQSKLEYEGKVFLALHESHEVVSLNFVIKVANAFCLVHKSNIKSVYPLHFCDVKLLILQLSTWTLSDWRLVSCHSSLIWDLLWIVCFPSVTSAISPFKVGLWTTLSRGGHHTFL